MAAQSERKVRKMDVLLVVLWENSLRKTSESHRMKNEGCDIEISLVLYLKVLGDSMSYFHNVIIH